jgi:subtilisin family serine protease
MPPSRREDVLLLPTSAVAPGVIDGLNDALHDGGLGRPLRAPGEAGAELVAVPVVGTGTRAVRDFLRAVPGGPEVRLDVRYEHGTAGEPGPLVRLAAGYGAMGKVSGHGAVAWEPVDEPPRFLDWRPGRPGPVIALLDTGIRPHTWLPPGDSSFYRTVEWTPAVPIPEVSLADLDVGFGSHWGHATFIAGLILRHGAGTQVLSLRVMDHNGTANERNIIRALEHLETMMRDGQRLDVVLMAFGRPKDDGDDRDPDVADLKCAIRALATRGVTTVASAGNSGTTHPCLPAAFADDEDLSVVSVGAGVSEQDHDCYSNHGPWVKQWRPGTDLVSIMPLRFDPDGTAVDGNGFARWSGTSFAAAVWAAEAPLVPRRRRADTET